jgi:hypothetical protein
MVTGSGVELSTGSITGAVTLAVTWGRLDGFGQSDP